MAARRAWTSRLLSLLSLLPLGIGLAVGGSFGGQVGEIGTALEVGPRAGAVAVGPRGLALRLRFVPPGTYGIGAVREPRREPNATRHPVRLRRGVWIGETEVTQAAWRAVLGTSPSRFGGCGPDCPVESVNFFDAIAFANAVSVREDRQLCYEGCRGTPGAVGYDCTDGWFIGVGCQGYRLPTEAEWEVAARAGRHESRSDAIDLATYDAIGWSITNCTAHYPGGFDCTGQLEPRPARPRSCGPQPVGQKRPNAWGFRDLLGNVWEWTGDWAASVRPGLAVDPMGPTDGLARVLRGGSWWSWAPLEQHPALRFWIDPGDRLDTVGFRLARSQAYSSVFEDEWRQ